jgi:hypothetical protein
MNLAPSHSVIKPPSVNGQIPMGIYPTMNLPQFHNEDVYNDMYQSSNKNEGKARLEHL